MKILLTGGGTAGHLTPLIAIVREFHQLDLQKEIKFTYYGPKDPFTEMLLSVEGVEIRHILAGKVRRYWSLKSTFENLFDIFFRFPIGTLQAFWKIYFLSPDFILSKGGYGALPVTIAGWILRTPVFLHESDAVPGAANRIAASFALEIFTSFLHTSHISKRKRMLVGNPIRRAILRGSKEEGIKLLELQGDKPIVFIIGGSQGSRRINETVLTILEEMTESLEIIHQTGEKNYETVRREANALLPDDRKPYYHPVAFLKEIELRHIYAAADIVVGRAGSNTIFEVAAVGKPAILIPLPESAQNHQVENAYAYAKTGAAVALEENNMTPHFFLERIKSIVFSKKEHEAMTQAAYAFAKPESARIIATYIADYISQQQ